MSLSPSVQELGDDDRRLSHSARSNEHSPTSGIRAASELVTSQ